MAIATIAKEQDKGSVRTRRLFTRFRTLMREIRHGLFEQYRPERHYMRGPGPKWCERHGLG